MRGCEVEILLKWSKGLGIVDESEEELCGSMLKSLKRTAK